MDIERVKGVVPPAVTPLTAEGKLDEAGMAAVIEHLVNGGVHGIFMMGTTGEAYVLPDALRARAVSVAGEALGGRLPLYVGVGDSNVERTLRNAEHAAKAGADVLVLISPPSLDYTEDERAAYLAEMAGRMPLPVLLYNIPQVNKNPVTVGMLRRLIEAPNVIGMKDSEGNAAKNSQVLGLLAAHPDFRWFEGIDRLSAASLLMGAHGIVNGGTNVFPKLYVALYEAAVRRDVAAVQQVQQRLLQALKLFEIDLPGSTGFGAFLKATKYALQVMGVCQAHTSFPFGTLGPESRKAIERHLAELAE